MEQLIKKAHGMAKEKGFWETERNVSELLMLIVSELAEALEALRKEHFAEKTIFTQLHQDIDLEGSEDEIVIKSLAWKQAFETHIKSSFEDEIADVAIRLFDLCGGLGIDLEKHIETKMKYNSLRPYKHGKKF
jgi:NTP pyrophosphatase (non-canonical NTP hydrolase)